ncbi:MAG TPA: alpha/beta hydrolase-fold protein [Bacteroidota bacterium]|nr:alpha/beta hydrolase-fold protein [Bacteroidota bacterium]
MKSTTSTLVHKIIEPKVKSSGQYPAIILLHGRGANENDLLELAEYLDERLFIISARAPFTLSNGGFTWYDILDVGMPEPAMFEQSYAKLMQFLDDVKKNYPVNPAKIFFGGFSMGTVMSFCVALTQPASVAGVAANSGLIPEGTSLQFQWNAVKGKPFFVAHGKYDPIIPVSFAQRARELLQKAEACVTYREYDMQHQISEESLNDLMQWLSRQLH